MNPFTASAGAVLVAVRVTPGAGGAVVGPVMRDADGTAVVKARVTAVAENGKANVALRKLLAREWRIAPSRIEVVRGTSARRKTVRIEGEPSVLMPQLTAWLEAHRE